LRILLKELSMRRITRKLLHAYVDDVKARALIKSEAVERAFRRVERHRLLEVCFSYDQERGEYDEMRIDPAAPSTEHLEKVYSDSALVTRVSGGLPSSSTSQPALVARMLELLDLTPGQRVLEVGAGTGYNAALVQEIVGRTGHVTTIDIQEDVVAQTRRLLQAAGYDRIEVIARDGALGCPENAPYDRIIATVGCPDISYSWTDQLTEGGFMLVPLQHGGEGFNPLVRIWREGESVLGKFVGFSGFMSIQGELAAEQRLSFGDQKQATAGSPIADRPLPEPVSNWYDLEQHERWLKLNPLYLFLAIADGRTGWGMRGYGIAEPGRGACLIGKDMEKVDVYGDPLLYDELVELCARWKALGSPGTEDWALEFLRRDACRQSVQGENAWLIPRKFTIEFARLQRADGAGAS